MKLFIQGHNEWQNPDEKRGLVHSVDTSEWLARDEEEWLTPSLRSGGWGVAEGDVCKQMYDHLMAW